MNRRAFFGAAALVVSSPVAALSIVSEIEALIKQHETAWKRDDAAWQAVGVLDGHPELKSLASPRVQIGTRRGQKRDDGEYEALPIYAFNDADIDQYIDRNLETQMMFVHKQKVKESLLSKTEAYRDEKKAELARLEAQKRTVENEIGRTKACRYAEQCSAETKEIEDKILSFKPTSLRESALQAMFVLDVIETGHGYVEEEDVIRALKSIAKATDTQQLAA